MYRGMIRLVAAQVLDVFYSTGENVAGELEKGDDEGDASWVEGFEGDWREEEEKV
jgi:hypothetical protein